MFQSIKEPDDKIDPLQQLRMTPMRRSREDPRSSKSVRAPSVSLLLTRSLDDWNIIVMTEASLRARKPRPN
jgi:hypothetical protein